MTLLVCVGMASEASLIGQRPGVLTIIGAGDAKSLAAKLETAIASGGVTHILSLGVAGALAPDLQVGELVIGVTACSEDGNAVVHADKDWTQRLSRALTEGPKPVTFPVRFGNVASSILPTATVAARAALRASTGADIVDQESWIAASAAKAHALPLAILRATLDLSDFDLPVAAQVHLGPDGSPDLEAILWSVVKNPLQIPKLTQLAFWSETAVGNLAVALASLGNNFQTDPIRS